MVGPYPDRKPDREYESFKVWIDNKPEAKKKLDPADVVIKYKGMELVIGGFNRITDKKTNKLIFAYKFKHQDRAVVFFMPEDLTPFEKEKVEKEVIPAVVFFGGVFSGYAVQDLRETLDSFYHEQESIMRLADEKRKKHDSKTMGSKRN